MSELGYKIIGSGEDPVIVMHAWLGDHSSYALVIPYLNRKDFRWIFVDLRGYGLSKQLPGEYSCQEAANDIQDLMQSLDLGRTHLVGHSMSAMVAQRIAADIPARIKTLVLVAPVSASGFKLSTKDRAALRKEVRNDRVTNAVINTRNGSRYESIWLQNKLAATEATAEARTGYLEMFLNTDFSQDVIGLNIPVRVLVGEQDIPAFRENQIRQIFSRWYPDLEIKKCPESGHYPMLERPVFFASSLEQFISNAGSCRHPQ